VNERSEREREGQMMKVELYLDIFRNGIRRLGQNIDFSLRTFDFYPDGLIMSINRSINEKRKKNLEGKKMNDKIDLHFNLLAMPILYNDI